MKRLIEQAERIEGRFAFIAATMSARRAGHTYGAVHGCKESGATLVTFNSALAVAFRREFGINTIGLDRIDPSLRGCKLALVFDNSAINKMVQDALILAATVDQLARRIKELEAK